MFVLNQLQEHLHLCPHVFLFLDTSHLLEIQVEFRMEIRVEFAMLQVEVVVDVHPWAHHHHCYHQKQMF